MCGTHAAAGLFSLACGQQDSVEPEEEWCKKGGNCDLPRWLCWGVGVRALEGEGEGVDEPEDLVLRGGMRALWAVREAEGPCRGP